MSTDVLINLENIAEDMKPFFEAVIEHTPPPQVDLEGYFQMQISALDYDTYTGVIGIGRIERGQVAKNTAVKIIDRDNDIRSGRILDILKYNLQIKGHVGTFFDILFLNFLVFY